MGVPIEKIYAGSLLAGFCFSAILFLSAGQMLRFRFRFLPRLRLTRFFPKLRIRGGKRRLPRFRPFRKTRVAADSKVNPQGPKAPLIPPWAGPMFLGTALTSFGICGLSLSLLLHVSPLISVSISTACATASAFLSVWAFGKFFEDHTIPMEGTGLIGTVGHVSVAIPAGGVGAIAYVSDGRRATFQRAPNEKAHAWGRANP